MHKKTTFVIFLCLLFGCMFRCSISTAQFPQFHFENITTQKGISSNVISCLYQDKKGFLWIGTTNGLNKYDGNVFQTFYHEEGNRNSLSGNSIVQILEDNEGIFWIATRDGGLTRYDPSQFRDHQFTQIKNNPADASSLPSNRMTAICDYNTEYLLVGSENMILGFLNKKTLTFSYYDFKESDTPAQKIDFHHLLKKSEYNTWVHHFEHRGDDIYFTILSPDFVYVINSKTNTITRCTQNRIALSIPEFYVDNDYIWVASWNNGVYVQNNPVSKNRETPELQKKILFADDEFSCFASFNENFMLAGGRSTGMYVINKKTFAYERLYHDRSNTFSLAANQVTCMLADKNNILWIGTSGGLSKYNPVQWQFHAQPVSENFEKEIRQFSIHENEDGGLSICTADGLYMKSKTDSAFHLREYYYQGKKLSPTSIHKLDDGRYLMTTEDNSFWYQPQTSKLDILYPEKYFGFVTNEFYKYNPMTRGSYQVRFIEQGTVQGHSLLYFGTMGWGLGIYDETDNIYYDLIRTNDKKSLGNNLVRTMLKDSQSDVWLGTADGLYKWNKSVPPKNDFEAYVHLDTDSTSISNNNITGLYEDKNHHLWISTANGLNEFDGKRFYHYIPRFKSSKNMYGIYADEKNNLCTAVPDGFEIFNLNTKTFHHVTIPNNEWLLKYAAQIMKHSNGDWMYGAGNFVITFNTAQYVSETAFPEIYLTGFSVFDKKIFETEEFNNLKFKHNNNFFTITFSSLQLSQPSTVKYQYWLKGLNDQWIDIGNDEKIVFTSLPPGKFQLYAKVTNAQGAWSVAKELVTFTVSSPYWQQWWFFVLCAALIGLAVYAFIKLREKQYLQLQTMRNKIANDLHDDVGSALSTINLYSEVAKMKTEKENEELKTILDKISNTSIEMQENMSHIVWSLQPRNDEFEQMILRLKRYAVENMQAKNIKTEFSIDEKLQELKMSPEKRKELFLIYKEALHNILKYANCTEVKILFSKTKHEMQMQIQDNGAGFDITEKFTGNGLHTMHERAKALQGKLILNSQPGKGTSVMLQFPL